MDRYPTGAGYNPVDSSKASGLALYNEETDADNVVSAKMLHTFSLCN